MGKIKKALFIAIALLVSIVSYSQDQNAGTNSNEGFMRSEGKIYVVMAVVLTILAGLLLYVYRLDRKITKLEKGESL